ncbi:MAG: hypothetical protein ACOY93_19825 [Bacillota bacterium]
MVDRPAEWFRIVAVCSGVLGVAMVFLLNALIHSDLSLWLHVPLTILVLTLLGGSAILTGVAFVEFNARQQGDGKQESH